MVGRADPEWHTSYIDCLGELGENKNYFEVFASDGITDQDADLKKTEFVNGRNSVTWNWKVGSSDNTMIGIYAAPGGSSATSTIHKNKT